MYNKISCWNWCSTVKCNFVDKKWFKKEECKNWLSVSSLNGLKDGDGNGFFKKFDKSNVEAAIKTVREIAKITKETVVGSTSIFNWDILSGNLGFSVLDVNESQIDDSDFKVFPSPAFNELYIDSAKDSYSFTISNIRGQLIYENKSSREREKVDVSNFPSGLYFLTISCNRGLETIRFVKK